MRLLPQLFFAFGQHPFDVSLDPYTFDVHQSPNAEASHAAHGDKQDTTSAVTQVPLSGEYNLTGLLRSDTAPSLYERNCAALRELQDEIGSALRTLDEQLRKVDASHQRIMPLSLNQAAATLSWRDTATRWHYQAQAAASVTMSTLGWSALVTGLPYIASRFTDNLLISSATWLGAGYVGANRLRNIPDGQRHQTASGLIDAKLLEIQPLQHRLALLHKEETTRQQAMTRVITIFAERQQHLCHLEQAFDALTLALGTKVPTTDAPLPDSAFLASLRSFVTEGLSPMIRTMNRFIAALWSLVERYAAYQAERAYHQGEGKPVLAALTTKPLGRSTSIVNDHYRCALANYECASGLDISQADVRRQLYMGENIAYALTSSTAPTPGAVIFQGDRERVVVTSNLTTTRALAWYFDSAADQPPSGGAAAFSAVQRADDGSLLIADPDGKLYDFLMQAPCAYTRAMFNARDSVDDLDTGRFHVLDYYAGFPRATKGMQFERDLGKTGAFALRVTLLKDTPVYGMVFKAIPLADKHHLAYRVTATSPPITSRTHLAAAHYESISTEELHRTRDHLIDEMRHHIHLLKGELKQLSELENWENPCFHTQPA